MPIFELEANGKTFEIEAPDQAAAIEAFSRAGPSLAGSPPPPKPDGSGLYMNATAGLNSSIYNTLGAPVDAATWAVNKGLQGINAATGADLPMARDNLPGSSRSLANAFGAVGVAKPEDVVAASPEERIARGVGEGVGYTVAPQAVVGGAVRAGVGNLAPRTMDALGKLTGQTASVAQTAGNALAGGAAGAGAAAGAEAAPEEWKGLAGLGGGLAGGALGTLAASVPSLARSGGRVASEFFDPFTDAGRQRAAGRELWEAATDPAAARLALEDAPAELVPGSKPTTFQASGDMGLGALERRVQTQNPDAFMQRRADQNTARLAALDDIQPGGAPEAVSKAFRDRLAAIDAETESALTAATEAARGRTRDLGGNLPPEAYGDALRGSLASAEKAARERTSALWGAIDPENKLNVPTSNSAAAAKATLKDMSEYAKPMEGEEAAVFRLAAQMPGEVRVRMIGELRRRVNDALRTELQTNGTSASYARLSRLRGALEDDIDGVIRQRAAADERAVAAGQMAPEDSLIARWEQEANERIAARQGEARQARRASAGASAGQAGTVGRDAFRGGYGDQGEEAGGFGRAASNPGLPGDAGRSAGIPFDDAARERLKTATNAIRERHQTFGAGANPQILRRSGQSGPYELSSASVPGRLFFPGSASSERIAQFRQAAGDAQALEVLQDYAAAQLRKTAERPDGTLDPTRLAGWRRNHADALRAFPELDVRFADAGRASQAMAEAAATRRTRLDDYQKGLAGRLMNANDPGDVTRTVGAIFARQDAATTMQGLAASVKDTPAAREGLRKAVADYVAGRFVGHTEAATTGQGAIKSDGFQTFVAQNRRALRHVFSDEEIATLDRIAVDIQRSNRSLNAVRIPGQSNTAQDTTRIRKDDGYGSILGRILAGSAATGAAGWGVGGPVGAASFAIGGAGVSALRQYGVRNVEDLVRDAMLDPQLAKVLLQRTPAGSAEGVGRLIARRYRASASAAGAATFDDEEADAGPAAATGER